MILGVDHISFRVPDLEAACNAFDSLGYKVQFKQGGIANDPSKRALMWRWTDLHDISYLRPAGPGTAVEVIYYPGESAAAEGRDVLAWEDIYEGPSLTDADRSLPTGLARQVWGTDGQPIVLEDHRLRVACLSSRRNVSAVPRLHGVMLPVVNLAVATAFWTAALGIQPSAWGIAGETGWSRFDFGALHPSWSLRIALFNSPIMRSEKRRVDLYGWVTVCLLTTDVDADRTRLASISGVRIGHVFSPEINSQRLKVCVGEAPCGELIELIEIVRPARRQNAVAF